MAGSATRGWCGAEGLPWRVYDLIENCATKAMDWSEVRTEADLRQYQRENHEKLMDRLQKQNDQLQKHKDQLRKLNDDMRRVANRTQRRLDTMRMERLVSEGVDRLDWIYAEMTRARQAARKAAQDPAAEQGGQA